MSDPVRYCPHFRDVPEGAWRWPNFSPAEIASSGTDKLIVKRERIAATFVL